MEKHPYLTLERISRVVDELRGLIWRDLQPLQVAVYQCAEPISYAEAVQQAYAPVAPGFRWRPRWSTAWFHIRGDYPAEWAGETVAALIDVGAEALVWQHGVPAQGLDENRRDFVLPADGMVDLYVEAAALRPYGGGDDFVFGQAAVARLDAPVRDLYFDMFVLFDLARQLPADSARRVQVIYALNEAVNAYRRGGADAMETARAALAGELARPAATSASQVCALGHSHIDVAYRWPIRETIRKCSRTFATVLKYLEAYPEYRFVQSQPQLYTYMKERFPELYARIRQAVADGRWEPQGGMWVEADCNIISGESMVRQFLHGTRFFREEFGIASNVLWLPDVFGYSAAMPQILRGCGIPYFLTQKLSWNQFNPFPHHTFWWEGIDGSRVLAHFPPADNYNGVMTPAEVTHGETNYRDNDRAPSWMYLFGHGDGGGGPTREMLECARRMANTEGLPPMTQEFSRTWFPRLEAEARDLRTWVGELYFELHRGTYTTQAKNKWENRHCEFLLRDAEFLAAMQPGGASVYPADALEQAWKLVLLNQFHDILPGSSIGWAYEDSARDYAAVHVAGDAVVDAALDTFAAHIDTEELHHPVMVWNTLSFSRSGLVEIPWAGPARMTAYNVKGQITRTQVTTANGGRRLLAEVVDLPSMGYAVFDLQAGGRPKGTSPLVTDTVRAGERVLENDFVRVELNHSGEVTAFFDKAANRDALAPGAVGNHFQLYDDHPNNYDAWDIDPSFDEVEDVLETVATLTVVEKGPLRAAIRVERQLTPDARLVQDIRLEANSRRVDFVTRIEWQAAHSLLKVAFPVNAHSARATYDIQYGHVERPTHRNTSWDVARFEVCAHKWADLSESDYGVALLNDGKYGYDILGNVMRLTLLRAPKHPDDRADMGTHAFTYSLLPHRGDVTNSGVPLAGYDVNVPFRTRALPVRRGALARTHSYFRLDVPNLVIEAVKRAEDGDGIIVRLYEAYRRRGAARLITNGLCSRATRTDLLERDGDELAVRGGAVTFDYKPFEIITLRLR